jgi:nitronate monooxygenase
MNWQNKITGLLNIKYPFIQAPMLGVTSPEMVAAVAAGGGLGSLPLGGLSPAVCAERITRTKSLTARPFAVNLFAHAIPEKDDSTIEEMQRFLHALCQEHNMAYQMNAVEDWKFYTYEEQIDIIIREQVPVVSFTFGVLQDAIIERLQGHGIVLIGTCTSVKEAKLLEAKGIDIICAQGIEAGGHRASFLYEETIPQIGTFSLVPQVCDSVRKPVVAAGGVFDGRTIQAAFILGAAGVQVGSAFIAAEESLAGTAYKKAVQEANDTDTVLTKSFTGRWARGIKNTFIDQLDNSGVSLPPFPYQGGLTAAIRKTANEKGKKEFISLWCGQSGGNAQLQSTSDIFNKLIAEAESVNSQR